ncbi:oligosaccharide flippase family protein [Halobacillus sp. A1]|uniref:lipopolysaccharide biosynthesis protein n=1 Tax=Halobacillus sp. A1 TaxID=2880262 RepID=UPI0020A69CC5|nr:oligosaccharide flippase family protein [Halobacillus sp. A1]MCP3032854.1 oligosaccharide flippase family protein [Halobacillus sp. A1]
MVNKLKKLLKTPFVRNVMIMATGTAAAQLVNILLQPVITRLYGPEAYGLMGTFMAIVAIIGPVAAFAYPIAIVLPKSDKDAKGLIRLSLYITTAVAVIVGLILLFLHQPIVNIFNMESIAPYLFLIPIVIIFAGLLQVSEQWFIRTNQFAVNANATFFQAILLNGSKAGIGFFYPVAPVLIVLSSLNNGVKALFMILFARKSSYKSSSEEDDKPVSLKELAKRHNDFPMFRAPQVFINAISQNLPIILLTSLFGPAAAGFYSICKTVLAMPSQLIGKSVGDVFYPRITEAAHKGESITHLVKKATLALAAVGFLPYLIVILFGPWLFSFVFGADWVTAGEYARWIALWMFFMFINQPSVKSLPVMGAQAFHLRFTIFNLVIRMGLLAVGYYVFSSDVVAVALFGISGAVLNIILILLTLRMTKRFD